MNLERVWWTDATCVAAWHDCDELYGFATNQRWRCNNTGWNVYEDDECVVLSGRMTNDGEHLGLIERIPKKMIENREILYTEPRS